MGRLSGRVAIVTGAGAGNGLAIAAAFAAEGASVVCADLDGDAATSAAAEIESQGGRALAIEMDHSDANACDQTAAAALAGFGGIDVLVNNAGVARTGMAHQLSAEALTDQLKINVLGPLLMTRSVLEHMMSQRSGSIIMISSVAGISAKARQLPYVVSKHAVIGLMRSIAVDYGQYGIRANAICPAFIRTAMTERYVDHLAKKSGRTRELVIEELSQSFALGRLGSPTDVAGVAMHFASAESAWTTGEVYLLDGGEGLSLGTNT